MIEPYPRIQCAIGTGEARVYLEFERLPTDTEVELRDVVAIVLGMPS